MQPSQRLLIFHLRRQLMLNRYSALLAAVAMTTVGTAHAESDAGACNTGTECTADYYCFGGTCVEDACVCPPPDPCKSRDCRMGGFCPAGCPRADAGTDAGAADAGTDAGAADAGTDGGAADAGTDGGSGGCSIPAGTPSAGWALLVCTLISFRRRRLCEVRRHVQCCGDARRHRRHSEPH